MKSFLIALGLIVAVIAAYSIITAVTSIVWVLIKLALAIAVIYFILQYIRKK